MDIPLSLRHEGSQNKAPIAAFPPINDTKTEGETGSWFSQMVLSRTAVVWRRLALRYDA